MDSYLSTLSPQVKGSPNFKTKSFISSQWNVLILQTDSEGKVKSLSGFKNANLLCFDSSENCSGRQRGSSVFFLKRKTFTSALLV